MFRSHFSTPNTVATARSSRASSRRPWSPWRASAPRRTSSSRRFTKPEPTPTPGPTSTSSSRWKSWSMTTGRRRSFPPRLSRRFRRRRLPARRTALSQWTILRRVLPSLRPRRCRRHRRRPLQRPYRRRFNLSLRSTSKCPASSSQRWPTNWLFQEEEYDKIWNQEISQSHRELKKSFRAVICDFIHLCWRNFSGKKEEPDRLCLLVSPCFSRYLDGNDEVTFAVAWMSALLKNASSVL